MNDKVLIYEFKDGGTKFFTNFPPDRNFKKQVEKLFSGYDQYAHMKDFNSEEIRKENQCILETIYSMGVFKITVNNNFSDVVIFENVPKASFLKKNLIDYFTSYKNENPRIGLVSVINNIGKPKLMFTDWLPRMMDFSQIFGVNQWENYYDIISCNIICHEGVAYFVLFQMDEKQNWYTMSYVEIGDAAVFSKGSDLSLSRTKMLQILSMHDSINDISNSWSKIYNKRKAMCSNEIQPVNFYDMLIYLYQLLELTNGVSARCKNASILWTTVYSEFNKQFREFKGYPYTKENRENILELFKDTQEKAYAFLNDFFGKEMI